MPPAPHRQRLRPGPFARRLRLLRRDMVGQQRSLIGPQRVDRRERFIGITAKQHRRTLPLEIAEIGAVLRIPRKRGEFRRKAFCDLGRIGQPLVFIWLQPSETIADDNPLPYGAADIGARPVQRRPQEDDGIARFSFGDDRRLARFLDQRLGAVARRPDQRSAVGRRGARVSSHMSPQLRAGIKKVFIDTPTSCWLLHSMTARTMP